MKRRWEVELQSMCESLKYMSGRKEEEMKE